METQASHCHEEVDLEFKWGVEKGIGGKNKDIMFYESFTYKGEEFFVYDCVYFDIGEPEASIGKLVKIFEGPSRVKKVKVVWFMRPSEIRNFLGDYEPRWNEVFLATGKGRGVSNINLLESIVGKCTVVCTSDDHRNPHASEEDLRWADYFFCNHFDVRELVILHFFPDMVDGVKVENFFNKKEEIKPLGRSNIRSNANEQTTANFSGKFEVKKAICDTSKDDSIDSRVSLSVKESTASLSMRKQVHLSSESTLQKPKIVIRKSGKQYGGSLYGQVQDKVDKAEVKVPKSTLISTTEVQPYKKRKLFLDESASAQFDDMDCQLGHDMGINNDNQLILVSKRPNANKRNWFKQLHWEQRLERAQEAGCLVSLENLDASYTAEEIGDLLWHALAEMVEVKMIEQSSFSSPHHGKAFVIFKSKEAADLAISKLTNRCLMLEDGRPVIARKETLRKPDKLASFVGHHTLDRGQVNKQTEEMKKVKSTSHSSQPNNIEYDMGMEWLVLQEKIDMYWRALYERQAKEIRDVRNQLKMTCNS